MNWGNNPMGDFTEVVDVPAQPEPSNVIPIHPDTPPQFAEAGVQRPASSPTVYQEAQLVNGPSAPATLAATPEPEGPTLQGLAMHLAPVLVAAVAGAAAGGLAAKSVKGALIGTSAAVAVVGVARALAGGMYGIPMQLRAMDGAAAVAGAVAAGYLAFFSEAPKTKKTKAKKRRPLFLQREDDFDDDDPENEAD